MLELRIDGYAKVNLGLDVVRRLPNGYHEVRMIMQTVGVHDTITLKRQAEGITFITQNGDIPCDDTNLAYVAAKRFIEESGIKGGVAISLEKRIPVAAGLAGGSTDAAAVLKGMNLLYETGFSSARLMDIGVKIGADVPYCIQGGTALAEGIGEKLTPLCPVPDAVVLLAKPKLSVSTKEVYERLEITENTVHPDIDGMMNAIREGNLTGLTDRMGNVLQDVTAGQYPVILKLIQVMEQYGAQKAMMSGSGPTVFGIFQTKEEAKKCKNELDKMQRETKWINEGLQEVKEIYVTTFVNPIV